jgi:hypothetical protein
MEDTILVVGAGSIQGSSGTDGGGIGCGGGFGLVCGLDTFFFPFLSFKM